MRDTDCNNSDRTVAFTNTRKLLSIGQPSG